MIKEIKVPNIGVDEVEITEISVKIGDDVKMEQPLIVVEGDKASIEIPSPYEGKIKEIKVKIGDKVGEGSLIIILEQINHADVLTKKNTLKFHDESKYNTEDHRFNDEQKENNSYISDSFNETNIHATPMIRRLARDLNIDLNKIKGSGKHNRVLKEDMLNYFIKNKKNISNKNISNVDLLKEDKKENIFDNFGLVEEIEINRIKKISGEHLSNSWMTIPHVTQHDEIDVTDLESFRTKQNIEIQEKKLGYKITLLIFLIKSVANALKKFPLFNSTLSENKIILKKYINISIAVNTSQGLLVPVIKNVNEKGVLELSSELNAISKKAKNGSLTFNEMQGGNFTISNLGNVGGSFFTPIINAPQVSILGISKTMIKPLWNGKKFKPRLLLPLSLSFDHRVIDGFDGACFISYIKKLMSDIRILIM